MRIFATGTGRCGTVTFARACRHIRGFTSGHETHTNKTDAHGLCGDILNLEYPDNHIEVSPQLAIAIPLLKKKYPDARWVHMIREDRAACAQSLLDRADTKGFARYWFLNVQPSEIEVAGAIYDAVNAMCWEMLPDAFIFRLEHAKEDWRAFWSAMHFSGDFEASLAEWDVRHNAGRKLLSICMPTLASRAAMRTELVESLQRQIAGLTDTELLIEEDAGEMPSGAKRHKMSVESTGKYIAMVDDDDAVSPDYVAQLRKACLSNADVVTFNVRRTGNDRPPSLHRFRLRAQDHTKVRPNEIEMAANHLCAWRRDIQRCVAFTPTIGYNDDCFWYKPLIASGIPATEHYIDAMLYEYRYHSSLTANQRKEVRKATFAWAGKGIECFRQANQIYLATASIDETAEREFVEVRNRYNARFMLPRVEATPFYLCKAD